MGAITINTHLEFKEFVSKNRKSIKSINGVVFNELYPILDVTKKHALYYDIETQGNKFLQPPFVIQAETAI